MPTQRTSMRIIKEVLRLKYVLKNYPVEGNSRSPLAAYKKENMLKLFLMDVGLLNHMLGVSYKEI
jgi:hypothetical protein